MQLTRFSVKGRECFGIVRGSVFADLSSAFEDFAGLAAADSGAIEKLSATAPLFDQSEVRRLVPLTGAYRVFCAALNYHDHAKEVGLPVPSEPLFFFKQPESMIDPDAPIVTPRITQFLDYEAELGVVIGRSGRDIPEDRAADHILGYCTINEVSARDLQVRKDGPRPVMDWFSGKALDGIAPIGPYVVTRDSVADADDLAVRTRLNGEVVQDGRTSGLIFSVPKLISYLSQRVRLRSFDVIATGTPSGVGAARGRSLQPGDVVEVSVERVGTLSNVIKAAPI